MSLEGMKVAVLAEDNYEDLELWYPYYRLKEAGAEVVIVAPEAGKVYQSKHGYPAKADLASADARADEFDGVVVPGGFAPDRMRRDPELCRFVRELNEQGKVVAGICHAGWMLISAKVVKGRRATSVSAIRDDMENAGAIWLDQEVVQDGNLITSRTPADLPAFMKAIVAALEKQKASAEKVAS
ncbi:MAG: type 1 glutamine amidotransferase domain-containing protein [Anaerolineae bacterium]